MSIYYFPNRSEGNQYSCNLRINGNDVETKSLLCLNEKDIAMLYEKIDSKMKLKQRKYINEIMNAIAIPEDYTQ